jgi:hypothetical protein
MGMMCLPRDVGWTARIDGPEAMERWGTHARNGAPLSAVPACMDRSLGSRPALGGARGRMARVGGEAEGQAAG